MPGIEEIKSYGWMAQASYLDMTGLIKNDSPQALSNVLRNSSLNADKRFAASQADEFVDASAGFSFQAYQPNTIGGFSATIFRSNADTSYTIAVRGTEASAADLFNADFIGVVLTGYAKEQLFSAYRFYKQLITAKDAQISYTTAELAAMAALVTGRSNPLLLTGSKDVRQDFGLGVIPVDGQLRFAGHSLGGHVAVLLAEMIYQFQPDPNIQSIRTFNSPGIGGILPELGNWIGIDTAITGGVIASKTLNLIGEGGLNVTSGLASVFGAKQSVFIETDGLVTGNLLASNHSIVKLSDSLAFQSLLVSIDSVLTIDTTNKIEKALSNEMLDTLEKGVEALYKIFSGSSTSITVNDREQLHSRFAEAKSAMEQISGISVLQVKSLVDAGDVAGLAKSDIAFRYSLRELSPLAIAGTGYSQFNTQGQLDLYNPATEKGLTDMWLEARAQALAARIAFNTADGVLTQQPEFAVDDKITGFRTIDRAAGARRLVFGADSPDALSGAFGKDKIFGGAGGDTISGASGDDYIEGNDGFDTIDAGTGDDEVYGGEGNDTISGFTGADKLYGGAGEDTIDGGLGDDIVYGDKKDAPDSTEITGDDTIDGGWGDDRIWGGGGIDTIRGGADDDQIEGNAGNDTLYGDDGVDTIKGGAGIDTVYGGAGRDTIEGGDDGDIIYGGNDATDIAKFGNAMSGGAGDDKLYGDGGTDTIDGGSGKDLLVGNFGADTLTGGSEDDRLYGDIEDPDAPLGDADRLAGGAGNDELFGGGGRDVLLGGEGEDRLRGGKGVGDYMAGGAGFDTYFYRVDDGADRIFDEDGLGRIIYDGQTLAGGKNKNGQGDFTWYDSPDDWRFEYRTDGDPDAGPVTLFIESRQGGLVEVRDWQNHALDIHLTNGNPNNPNPPFFPNGSSAGLPPPPPAGGTFVPRRGDPLVLDLDGLGIATLGLGAELHFDHDGDGFAERTGWVGAGDGVLVLDRDASGSLSNGQELFGDFTRLAGGQLALNGFQALSAWDANRDGRIDALDPVWTSLSVGSFDVDEETGEALLADPTVGLILTSLDELGIGSLSLTSAIVNATDAQGNTRTRTSSFTLTDGTTQELAEYRFARDNTRTKPTGAPVLSEETRALPGLAGGAQVLTLREALELDASADGYLGKPSGTLRGKLDAFTAESNAGAYYARFEELFNAWAGLDEIPEGQMRGEIGARKVAALEKFYGMSLAASPHHFQSLAWDKSYRDLSERFYGELLNQTHFGSHYEAMTLVEREDTTPYGNLMPIVPLFEAEIAADEAAGTARLHEFARSLRGRDLIGETNYLAFRERFILNPDGSVNEDRAFAFDSAGTPIRAGTTDFTDAVRAAGGGLNGGFGEDVLYGDGASGPIVGGLHDNVLYGGAGNDDLLGQEGGDLFDGGAGNDRYFGDVGRVTEGAGDDFYLFRPGSGVDRITSERGGIDTVFFGGGLTRSDVRVVASNGWGGMRFELPATGDVLHFDADWWSASALERFAFSDGTVLTLSELLAPSEAPDVLAGTPGADTLQALGGDDVIVGFAGADHLSGGEGADELDGGEGADLLEGGAGDDRLIPSAGDDIVDGGAGNDRIDLGSDSVSGYWLEGSGSDTFRFGIGDGADTIVDSGGFDTVLFKPGVTAADVALTNDGNNLVITLAGGADRITVVNHFASAGLFNTPNFLERVQFADGTVLAAEALTNATVTGTPEADSLHGYTAAQNLILGLEGDDALFGQGRADRLEGGEGADELSGRGGDDRLIGGAGDDRLFGEAEPQFISFLTEATAGGNDTLEGGEGDDLLHGAGGDDVLDGGTGNDTLHGGHGSDIYDGGTGDDDYIEVKQPFTYSLGADVFLFGRGAGHDTIIAGESDWSYWYWLPERVAGQEIVDDVVRLGPDIAPGDVTVFAEMSVDASGRHANVRLQVAGDDESSLTIQDFLGGNSLYEHLWSSVRRIEFGDGTVWGREDVLDRLTWQGTPEADVINAGQLRDRVFGEGGSDNLYGHAGDDFIDAGEGDDFIDGGAGSDTLYGGEGSDLIHTGGHGNDVIDGGAGDDRIGHWRVDRPEAFFFNTPPRLQGDVTVVFGPGSGNDRVFLPNTRPDSNDAIQVSAAPEDVKLLRRDGDLLLALPSTGEALTVQHWFDGAAYRVENIRFGDGAEWDAGRILAEVLIGTDAADRLVGYDSDDLVEGRAGDDLLDGGAGADVYAYARGDGNDTILASSGGDAIEFAAGITPDDLRVRNRGGMMQITLDSGEQITAIDQFSGFGINLAEVRFEDGTVWDEEMLRERALAGTPDDDIIEGFDTDDELAGGGGFDELTGGGGDDFYLFESGFLRLSDPDGFDTLSFGALTPDDVDFSLSNGELFIEVLATGDEVAIADFADDFGPTGNIEEFQFGDGTTVLSAFQVFTLIGAGDAEVIFGTEFDDSLEGSEGPTIVFSGDGDDIVDGEGGADELHGEGGSDLLVGGRGDDLIFGGDGDDRLDGGEGRDWLKGESGDDTFVLGEGTDLDDVIANEGGDGGGATAREGFEEAYEELQEELSALEDLEEDETFESRFWSSQSDGGAAADIPQDLFEPLFQFSGGVSVDFARQALSDLEIWLTTPLRQGLEWSYEEMEYAARAAFVDAGEQDDGSYSNGYWAELSWNYEVPSDIFEPLVQMQEGLPPREAQVALQQLLGWLYEIVGSGEDSSRFYFFQLYGEALVQIEEAQARLGEFSTFSNSYWVESELVDFLPEELRDRLIALDDDVEIDEAIASLEGLRDHFLQRGAGGSGEEDAIEFGEDIELENLEIATRVDEDTGKITELAIGIRGTNDGVIVSEYGHDEGNTRSIAGLSVRNFRLQEDGTELSLQDILGMADGTIGFQEGTEDADTLRGSAAEDDIEGDDGDDILLGRGNDDALRGQFGADILGGGAGDDEAHGGPGDDIIAGEAGDDALRGGPGNDVYLFNFDDGEDSIDAAFGDEGETDALSFGAEITPDLVSAMVAGDGTLTLVVDEGDGGSVSMASPVHRVQFVDEDGAIRIFDLSGLVASRAAELATTGSIGTSIALFDDASAFELTGSEAPAGGGHAVAYAQSGDLFAEPFYAQNEPSDEGDQLAGGEGDDEIDAGEGDDVVSGGAGDDTLFGGEGSDILSGGAGEDFLDGGGGGDDIARGGEGDDTYVFDRGDGTLTIHDNGHNTLELGGDIEFQELRLSHSGGFLEIRFVSEGDLVRIAAFEPANLFDEVAISTFYFESEDDEYDFETLLKRGFVIDGTDQADSLGGTAIHDSIVGGDGADFLAGGAGDDVLDGGSGGDTYFFEEGDGFDEIVDRESGLEQNTVELGASIDPGSIFAYFIAGDLFVEYGAQGDAFVTRDVDLGDPAQAIPFDQMRFADGLTLSLVDLINAGVSIEGSEEDDSLVGGTGGDTVFGLQGHDLLMGGVGADVYVVAPGDGTDTIDDVSAPGEENSLVFLHPSAAAADLSLVYDAAAGTLDVQLEGETVKLAKFDPADPFGMRAVDFVRFALGESLTYADLLQLGIEIVGTDEPEVLRGTAARDFIFALDGDDFIQASRGGDTVDGGAGDDVYSYNRGDGVLTIVDGISTTPQNALLFGAGIALADLRNNLRFEAPSGEFRGALVIDLGGVDRVLILGFDPSDAENGAHAVDTFVFADGAAVGYRDLVRNTFIVQGDTLDDSLFGTNIGDRLYGFEGADELRSGDGPDALTGGTGDDLLEGGAGGDEYVFNRGDGSDRIRDSAGFDDNFITFDAGITAADLSSTFDGADLRIAYGEGDEVTVEDFNRAAPVIRSLRFADGSTLDIGAALNTAPFAVAALENQIVLEDGAFAYAIPANAFDDADGGSLSISAMLADGYALPAWLAFDPLAGRFSGTAGNGDVGALTIRVLATDPYGSEAVQEFDLTVLNTNDAPVVANAVADQSATEDEAFSVTLPANQFADADLGDTLTVSLTLANGDALPGWLSYDPASRVLSGTPGSEHVGTVEIVATATDAQGATATDDFGLTIANVNDAPVAANAVADQAATEDAAFSFRLPVGTFADADAGDALTTFATLADGDPLPLWLSYEPGTLTFSGTPANEDVGTLSVSVIAVDPFGTSVAEGFDLAVANTNDAPLLAAPLADAFVIEDEAFSFTVSFDAFADPDLGDTLNFSADALPEWLSFDPGAGTFSGLATNDEVGAHLVQVTATDLSGATGTGLFALVVLNVNDAPVLAMPIPDQSAVAGSAFSFAIAADAFSDVDAGDSLQYLAAQEDGSDLPAWLSFDAASRILTGTPPAGAASYRIRVSAADTSLATASGVFALTVAGSGDDCTVIAGTDGDDVLNGTPDNDVIDGRKGYDRMSGGAGDDVYYVDRAGSKVDLVTEGAVAGYDTVYSSASYTLGSNVEELHLIGDDDLDGKGNSLANMVIGNAGDNRLYGEAGNDLLLDDAGDDRLDGGAGDDVLDGGAGDDALLGGAGNDLFVHTAGGGDDVVQDSGGMDAVRFGTGIAAEDLTVRRSDDDLVMRLSGGNGSVTVKDWFSSSAKRVEQVQFADGTVWNESAIRARVTSGGHGHGGHGGSQGDYNGYCDDRPRAQGIGHDRDDDGYDGHHGGRHDHKDHHGGTRGDDDCGTDEMRDAIAQRLKHNPNYDFTALAQYLQRNGGGAYGAMTPQQIAQRWLQVQNCVGSLAQADDECGGGHGAHGGHGGGYGRDDDGLGHGGWGHSGSTGQNRGCGGMDTFSGLGEGFRRL